jgi:hypothetical protein
MPIAAERWEVLILRKSALGTSQVSISTSIHRRTIYRRAIVDYTFISSAFVHYIAFINPSELGLRWKMPL